jgi:anti-sigma regulatory factor (Ser/Thr protein kinase)
MLPLQAAVAITELSHVAEARRSATTFAQRLGFDETGVGKVARVVTEAATNLLKHATRGGEVLLRPLDADGTSGIEMLAWDRGPGLANLGECLRDGYSTAGSPGTWLGALVRISDRFDIYSRPGAGTVLVTRVWSRPLPALRPAQRIDIGAVCLCKPGEEVCGDAWAVTHQPGGSQILVVDGLGHGLLAAEASRKAVDFFRQHSPLSPGAMLEAIHRALRRTRGAVAAVAEIDPARHLVRFSGVGNVAASIVSPQGSSHMVSHSGIVGDSVRKVQEFTYPWPPGALLVMHSDGLLNQWTLERYPGLAARDPLLIAGVLYRDFSRRRDDVTVVIARESVQ